MASDKPLIGVTMGDPAGIGPEVVLKALRDPALWGICTPVIVGQPSVLIGHAAVLGLKCTFISVRPRELDMGATFAEGTYLIFPTDTSEDTDRTRFGHPDALSGLAAFKAIEMATKLALEGTLAALATAPISKESLSLAGIPYPGHTEMIADICGSEDAVMMMVGGGIKVALVTIHCALRDVFDKITRPRIRKVLHIVDETFRQLYPERPHIGVCGLNPHASESGLFGDEEREIIAPAIDEACREGMKISGPFPADTIFHRALKGDFDVVLAMYHDQGLIPVKTLAFDEGVNVTLGLPIVRTSVDHGTAYDIAGKNVANPRSMIAAIRAAVELARGRFG